MVYFGGNSLALYLANSMNETEMFLTEYQYKQKLFIGCCTVVINLYIFQSISEEISFLGG